MLAVTAPAFMRFMCSRLPGMFCSTNLVSAVSPVAFEWRNNYCVLTHQVVHRVTAIWK
jgi:hypothetical protein